MPQVAVDFMLGTGWTSRSIAWFGGGPAYSHAASVLVDGRYLDAHEDVIDGVPAGVHIREADTESWIRKRRLSLEVTQAQYDSWEASLRAKIGDKYATTDIISFITGRPIPQRPGQWDCSGLVIDALQHIKVIPYLLPVAAHQITPNTAFMMLAAVGFTIGEEETQ